MNVVGLLVMGITRYLSQKMRHSSSHDATPRCAACSAPTTKQTACCGVPLCETHMRQWKLSPSPCPCRRR